MVRLSLTEKMGWSQGLKEGAVQVPGGRHSGRGTASTKPCQVAGQHVGDQQRGRGGQGKIRADEVL